MTKDPAEYPTHATNVQPSGRWSTPLNESWPPADIARKLNDTEPYKWISVRVRLVFDTGEEVLDGSATRWVNRGKTRHVYVTVNDPRLNSGGVWVDPADVSRS